MHLILYFIYLMFSPPQPPVLQNIIKADPSAIGLLRVCLRGLVWSHELLLSVLAWQGRTASLWSSTGAGPQLQLGLTAMR